MRHIPATFEDLKAAFMAVKQLPEKAVSPMADGFCDRIAGPLDRLYVESILAERPELTWMEMVWLFDRDTARKGRENLNQRVMDLQRANRSAA